MRLTDLGKLGLIHIGEGVFMLPEDGLAAWDENVVIIGIGPVPVDFEFDTSFFNRRYPLNMPISIAS